MRSRSSILRFIVAFALASLSAGTSRASAQVAPDSPVNGPATDIAPALEGVGRGLEFRLLLGAYLPRITGGNRFGVGAPAIGVESLDLDHVVTTPWIETTIRTPDHWEIQVNGFYYDAGGAGVFDFNPSQFGSLTLNRGDRYEASLRMASAGVEMAFPIWTPFDTEDTTLRLSPIAGLRWFDVQQSVSILGEGSDTAEGEWFAILGGVSVQMRYHAPRVTWIDLIQADLAASIGPALGGDRGFVYQIRGGVTCFFNHNLGLEVGYRLYDIDADNGSFEFDAALQGLFVGLAIRF